MAHQQEFNINQARLPRHLSGVVMKLHIAKSILGLLVLACGIASIIVYETLLYYIILGAALSSMTTGAIGVSANKKRSLVLHAGCALTSALSFYLSLLAYAASAAAAASYSKTGDGWLAAMNVLVLVADMTSSALNIGVELSVMYVAVAHQRLDRKKKIQEAHETGEP